MQTKSRNGSRVIDTQPIIKYPKFGDHYLSLLTSPQICWTVLWTWNTWSWLGWWLVGGQRTEKSIELNWSCCQLVGDLQRWRGLVGQLSLDIQQVGGFCSRRREVSRERRGLKISGGLHWEPAHSHLWCAVSAKARQTDSRGGKPSFCLLTEEGSTGVDTERNDTFLQFPIAVNQSDVLHCRNA